MPGHVKLGKAGEPDPDPCPYLVLTPEMKREDANKPYDPKKSYWCPDGKHGFMECILEGIEGGKANVVCGGFEVGLKYKKIHFYKVLKISLRTYLKTVFILTTRPILSQ